MLSSSWRNEALAPGALSAHHAQLVGRDDAQTARCASCHAAGNQSFLEWLSHSNRPTLKEPTQSDLCLNCHDKQIPRNTALLAHGLPTETLFAKHLQGSDWRLANPYEPFACSTCHREHNGANFDIKAMSNTACQACHQQQYHSFAIDHPGFENWPERRRTRIAFDHAAHQNKHFPDEKQEFTCSGCHKQSNRGFEMTLGYQHSCAKCHDSDIETSLRAGIELVSLPMIDTDALGDAGHPIMAWPKAAIGDFDGQLALLTRFLLLSQPAAANALEQLGSDFDFFDLDPMNSEQMYAAAAIIAEVTKLTTELAHQGTNAIGARLATIMGHEISARELTGAVAQLSPDDLSALQKEWFADPDSAAEEQSDASSGTVGWERDDDTFVLRYHPSGHDDAFLSTWLTLLSKATRGAQAALAEALLFEAMKPTAPGMCGTCHSVDRSPLGGLTVNWLAKQESEVRGFTRFSHTPHVLQTELADCIKCHRVSESADVMSTFSRPEPTEFAAGFHALTRQECASCHKPGSSIDNCTQCHNYHVGGVQSL